MITGFLLVEGTRARPSVPDWHELRAAMCGQVGDQVSDHPITRCARRLTEQHENCLRYPERANEIHGCRAALIAAIDSWVHDHIRPRATKTLGAAVDSLAAAYVHAMNVLDNAERGSDAAVHQAWSELAFLATAWADLVTEVIDGQPPLPSRS